MAKKDKEFRPKARVPRGFRDRLGAEIAAERAMLERITKVYESFGFDPLETPAFEYTDALGKFLPDVDRPNQGVFSLQDDDEQWMSLRYDLTAPLARFVAENYDGLPKPFRRYAVGPVWRNEKPGPGRFRQFTQCDADTVGAPAPHADGEICAMLASAIEAAGIERGDYVVKLNDRRIIDAAIETCGDKDAGEKRLAIMRAMDKLDRLGPDGVRLLLGSGRKDESGDYTDGAGLSDAAAARILSVLAPAGDDIGSVCDALDEALGASEEGKRGVADMRRMGSDLLASGYGSDRIRLDPSVIRGLEYYTGPVFEAELTFQTTDEKGRPVRFGSIGGGGRYDDLVKRFKGVEVPAVGVSIGVSRLLAALDMQRGGAPEAEGPVVVLALDQAEMARYQSMAAELRAAGVRAEVYLGGANFGKQLKYADKRRAPVAVIEGGDERARGEVTVKDLVLGAELAKSIEDNAQWREGQPAQVSVPRDKLVEAVRGVLSRRRS